MSKCLFLINIYIYLFIFAYCIPSHHIHQSHEDTVSNDLYTTPCYSPPIAITSPNTLHRNGIDPDDTLPSIVQSQLRPSPQPPCSTRSWSSTIDLGD